MFKELLLSLKDATSRRLLEQGDTFFFRSEGLISRYGRGLHSHAGKILLWGEDFYCVDVREWYGGRAVTIESQVAKRPGKIDIFETNPNNRWNEYNRAAACEALRKLAGCDYNYWGVLKAGILHTPIINKLVKPVTETTLDPEKATMLFCSEAVAFVDREFGGVDPVPWLDDSLTEPSDLVRSTFYKYKFTLTN